MPRATKPIPEFIDLGWKIVVDSNESAPYHFQNFTRIYTRGKQKYRLPLVVPTVSKALWAMDRRDVQVSVSGVRKFEIYQPGYADYSIEGLERYIQIERKSVDDLFSTLAGRRVKFEAEIKRLHQDCLASYVVIEGGKEDILGWNSTAARENPLDDLLGDVGDGTGDTANDEDHDDDLSFSVDPRRRASRISPASIWGTIRSWRMKYPRCHWILAGSRAGGEQETLEILQEFWDKVQEGFYGSPGRIDVKTRMDRLDEANEAALADLTDPSEIQQEGPSQNGCTLLNESTAGRDHF